MTSHAEPPYVARYGRAPKHIFSIGYGLVISAIILLIPAPAWVKAGVVAIFGGMAVMLAAITFSSAALRMDAAGVTIRPYPLRVSVIAFYPWQDVVQIRIVQFERAKGQFVHIRLREGAAWSSLSQLTNPRSRKALALADTGVAANGWSLHPARLAAAVARFAPAVQVIDAATGFVVDPQRPS